MKTPFSTTMRRLCAFSLLVTAGPAVAQVELHGGAFIEDEVVQVSPAGVTVAATGGGSRTLGWDEVKRVAGEHEGEASQYASLSDDLWRASRRLERGDVSLASPILERLWAAALANEVDPQTIAGVRLVGPTGLALADGVASARIAQGRLAEAVVPWTAAIALRRAVMGTAAANDPVWLDPALPPIFVQSVAVERLAATDPLPIVLDDQVARAMFLLYRYAAATAAGAQGSSPVIDPTSVSTPDVRLVTDMVIMQAGVDDLRTPARARLNEVIKAEPNTWREAWARAALGIAGVESDTPGERLGGALELMHIPARFSSSQPYLAGVGLAWASVALGREGDDARAAALLEELERIAPDHPAIGWLARGAGETR